MLQTERPQVQFQISSLDFFFFFNLSNLSCCTMALGFTQPLTEIKRGQRARLTTSPQSVRQVSKKVGSSMFHNAIGLQGLVESRAHTETFALTLRGPVVASDRMKS
jgi:hypothetical protein